MTKIISGILGLVLTLTIVAGSAYALFSSDVSISGLTLQTGNASLLIKSDADGAPDFAPTLDMSGINFAKLLPGSDDWGRFQLKNDNAVTVVDPLNLDLTGLLTSAGGDWGALKDVVSMVIYVEGESTDNGTTGNTSGWHTLTEWNAGPIGLPGDPLAPQAVKTYIVRFMLSPSAGNEAAGKTLTPISFVITGTQAL